jgi:hypothetical protein
MDFDDLVIGSGLAALGAVLGLLAEGERRVAVLCGPAENRFVYYDARQTVPCAFLGDGGLGSHWHGVIPLGWRNNFGASTDAAFVSLFKRFYPHAEVRSRLGTAALFVPWRPVRPARELQRLAASHGTARLTLIREAAQDLEFDERGVTVTSNLDVVRRASRAWVAAGALHTPALLARSVAPAAARGLVSDHAFCYVGQVDGQPRPNVSWTRDGVFFPAAYGPAEAALYTLRPAAFSFRQLDYGIEQRAVFGLPTGNALSKIARRMSPGLLVEAFYNRFGLFAAAPTHSVYAQVPVRDAYALGDGSSPLRAFSERIQRATDAARDAQPFTGLRRTQRPEIHLPGIHLHHSLDLHALGRAGVNGPNSPVQVVDASVLSEIGPDHHSFKMMLAAYERTLRSGAQCATVKTQLEAQKPSG